MRKFFIFAVGLLLTFGILLSPVSASHIKDVLGESTEASQLSIPPTSEGPGLLLPDSPIFFLDKLKQEFRLILAFSPEQKAKVHAIIAGERLAELQFMLAKNNINGIRISLQGVSDNLKKSSDYLSEAKLSGRDVKDLANSINTSIKEKQKSLSALEKDATGEIKAQVLATREALKVAKIQAEENLPADLLLNEMEDDLNQEISDNISRAQSSAVGINRSIDVLTKLATEAAENNQIRRQEALNNAIQVKNIVTEFERASGYLQKKTENVAGASEEAEDSETTEESATE